MMTEPVEEDDVRIAVLRRRGWKGVAGVARIRGAIDQGERLAALWSENVTGPWVTVATAVVLEQLLTEVNLDGDGSQTVGKRGL